MVRIGLDSNYLKSQFYQLFNNFEEKNVFKKTLTNELSNICWLEPIIGDWSETQSDQSILHDTLSGLQCRTWPSWIYHGHLAKDKKLNGSIVTLNVDVSWKKCHHDSSVRESSEYRKSRKHHCRLPSLSLWTSGWCPELFVFLNTGKLPWLSIRCGH